MPGPLPPIPGEFGELFGSFARHLRSIGRSPRTIESYAEGVARMVAYTGATKADDLTTDQLRRWLTHEHEVTAPGSVGVRYRSVRAFIRWCFSEGELKVNVISGIPAPKQSDNPVPIIEVDDLRKLLAQTAGTDWRSRRDRALVLFMLDSGCRRAEVTGVELDDIDMDRGEVVVLGKGGSKRIISLGATALAALDRWVRARRRLEGSERFGALWLGDRGPLSAEGIRQILKRLGREAGVSIHPHQLRHTAAHQLRAMGMGDAELMELMGWRSAAMLSKYSRSAVGARARDQHKKIAPGDKL